MKELYFHLKLYDKTVFIFKSILVDKKKNTLNHC